jgi:hypothetical protein
MHLVVPYAAGASPEGAAALHELRLPQLERLLGHLDAGETTGSDEHSLNLPHEQVLAACRGWHAADGCLPFAAWQARADGLAPAAGEVGWGLLTPTHWRVGREQVLLGDPAELQLDEAESRALLQAVRELFESLGWALHWGAPLRWYAAHESLAGLATASLERVIGRPIDAWLPGRLPGGPLRRLQSEVQMLLHTHPINASREARGALPVNSLWLSGTGRTPPLQTGTAEPVLDERLRGPLLHEDWAAWAEAWRALDAQVIGALATRAAGGESIHLTLCGERRAQHFASVRHGVWQRLLHGWRRIAVDRVLEVL